MMLNFVFSVDTTRVEISEMDPDVPGSDYINANYIRVSVFSIRQHQTRQFINSYV